MMNLVPKETIEVIAQSTNLPSDDALAFSPDLEYAFAKSCRVTKEPVPQQLQLIAKENYCAFIGKNVGSIELAYMGS